MVLFEGGEAVMKLRKEGCDSWNSGNRMKGEMEWGAMYEWKED